MSDIQRRLAEVVRGESHFVLVAGEAGIGKTRLLGEIEQLAAERDVRTLYGRLFGHDLAFPYQGFCEILLQFLGSDEPPSAVRESVDWSDLAEDLTYLFPMLADVPGIGEHAVGEHVEAPGGGEDKTAIFEVLARALARMAGARPLVLLFEDIHGANVSVEALQYIARRVRSAPILIVASYRPSEVDRRHPVSRLVDSFRGDRSFAHVALGPLSPEAHRELVSSVAGGEVDDALAEKLFATTEGNPFFAHELVRSLVESNGVVRGGDGRLSLSSQIGIDTDALPESIQQVVDRQIERLPASVREVLAVASVVGRTFEIGALEALAGAEVDVEEAVERLVRAGLFEERDRRGDGLGFASRIVRDATYARLPRRRRRSLHRRYAEYLEGRYAGRLDRVYIRLVHHYSHADAAEKTVEFAFLAATKALGAFSAQDTIEAARIALEFLEDGAWEGDPGLAGEARLLLAGAHRIEGDASEALREVERAVRRFEQAGHDQQALRASLMAAELAWEARKVAEAELWVHRGLTRARALGDPWSLSRLLTLGATVANLRSDYQTAKEMLAEAEGLRVGRPASSSIPSGGSLIVGFGETLLAAAEPAAIVTVDEEEVLANVFERLVVAGPHGALVPALCERWEMVGAGTSFRFTLREGVTFSTGEELTARDVKASFERAMRLAADRLPAAFVPIRGAAEAAGGGEVEGIVVRSEREIEIHLDEPLPIYPALLSDVLASVARVTDGHDAAGTGPFVVVSRSDGCVALARNATYWGEAPKIDAVEFRVIEDGDLVSRFRSGELDIVRGGSFEEIDRFGRERAASGVLVDAPRKESSFVIFNTTSGPVARDVAVRRAVAGVTRAESLVWQTLGRRAVPATGLIPPGMLGHDLGRKLSSLGREEAAALLRDAGRAGAELRVAVGTRFAERYGALLDALFAAWSETGIQVVPSLLDIDDYRRVLRDASGLDLLFVRWTADYDDPDNFTHGVFHSRHGTMRGYYNTPELDALSEQARAEPEPSAREALYRMYETALLDAAAVIPLFHEADCRLVSRRVRGLRLGNSAPFVSYSELGLDSAATAELRLPASGAVRVHVATAAVQSLDPALVTTNEHGETIPNVFETLLRVDEQARVVPWLAAEFCAEDGDRRYRFRLRETARFHGGRRLTSRDVRYTFERLLQVRQNHNHLLLLPIRGAKALTEGSVGDLEGFRIYSELEFGIELDEPLSIFPVVLSTPATAIVPEGSERFVGNWRQGVTGTGPFRVVGFEPGHRLELERNPSYWRDGYPRSERLTFVLSLRPEQAIEEFREGRLSVISGVSTEAVEQLRKDPVYASRYFEVPLLAIAFVACNTRRGPLSDPAVRRALVGRLDAAGAVSRALGRFAKPARGFVPPGLPGYDPSAAWDGPSGAVAVDAPIELTAAISSAYARMFSPLVDELLAALRRAGANVRVVAPPGAEYERARESGSVDLLCSAWVADYPDTDSLLLGVLHTDKGAFGHICGSEEIDRLVARGRAETDAATRHAIYREVEHIVSRDALLVPLFYPCTYRFAQPEVEGFACRSLGYPVVAYDRLRIR
jgi:peptide/nickel transport system substrate-binding protein/oligopeptide transport system substrate-binding protein